MSNKNHSNRLSFWERRYWYNRIGNRSTTSELSTEQLAELIDRASLGQFKKFVAMCFPDKAWEAVPKFDAKVLHPLFEPKNERKLCYLLHHAVTVAQNRSRVFQYFIDAAIDVATKGQIDLIIETWGFESVYLSKYLVSILVKRFDSSEFEDAIQGKKVSIDFIKSLCDEGLLEWLTICIKVADCDRLYPFMEKELIASPYFEEIKQLYRNKFVLGLDATLYYIKHGTEEDIEYICKVRPLLPSITENHKVIKAILDCSPTMVSHFISLYNEQCKDSLFPDFLELKFVQIADEETIGAYLQTRCLCSEAERELFVHKSDKLLMLYIDSLIDRDQTPKEANLRLLLEVRSDGIKNYFYQKLGYPYLVERELVKSGDKEKILAHLENFQFYPFNEALLVETADVDILEILVMDEALLTHPAAIALMKREGITKIQQMYLERLISSKTNLPAKAYHYLFANAETLGVHFVRDYLKAVPLQTDAAIVDLYCSGKLPLMACRDENSMGSRLHKDFIEKSTLAAFMTYVQNYETTESFEQALLEHGDDAKIKAYIEYTEFYDKSETLFVTQKDAELVRLYITKYECSDDAEIALIKRNDQELIQLYIEHHPISTRALQVLMDA